MTTSTNTDAPTETPWGLSWDQLFQSLRPTPSTNSKIQSIITHVNDALKNAPLTPLRLELGGPFGAATMTDSDPMVHIYAIFDPFSAHNYFEAHLKPLTEAVTQLRPRPASIQQNGFAVTFSIEGVPVSLFAAADLPTGPSDLVRLTTAPKISSATHPRAVHLQTSCAVYRSAALKLQPLLYKDMVRVAHKWLTSNDFMSPSDVPSHHLIQLLMLSAFRSVPIQDPAANMYDTIMRKFFALICTSSTSGDTVVADDTMPPTFLWWPFYYDRHVLDWCIASSLLPTQHPNGTCPLVIVDIAAPFVNVAHSLSDWGDLRRAAREALRLFERRDAIQNLQDRLQSLTDGFRESVDSLTTRVDTLQQIERSPRRWTGSIQFTEAHMQSEKWVSVMEITLRTIVWRVNARRTRTDGVGYSSMIDLSLQMIGPPLKRSLDVDVMFRSSTIYVVFDKANDHAFLQKRSEIIRNRDYPLQITVVA